MTSLSTDALSTGETVNSLISLRAADAKEETGQTETRPQTIVDLHQQGGSLQVRAIVPQETGSEAADFFNGCISKACQALGIPAFIVEGDGYRFAPRSYG